MSFQEILYYKQEDVATITLNRPRVFNALNNQMKVEIKEALLDAEQDSEVRVIVLTGEGGAFCSGQDLKAAQEELAGSRYSDAIREYYNPLILAMRNLPKPIICQLNGLAAGAGCSLALACDLIIAAESASLAELFVGIGLIMDSGSTYFLPRMIGSLRAFELAATGRKVPAAEAQELGLVNLVVPDEQLESVVQEYARQFAQGPTQTIGLIKEMLNRSSHMTLSEVLEYEAEMQDQAAASPDHREGIQAFLEKRKPTFGGQ